MESESQGPMLLQICHLLGKRNFPGPVSATNNPLCAAGFRVKGSLLNSSYLGRCAYRQKSLRFSGHAAHQLHCGMQVCRSTRGETGAQSRHKQAPDKLSQAEDGQR